MIFRPAILYVDDEEGNLDTFRRAFGSDYLVKTCPSAEEALKVIEEEEFPIVVADQRMPGMSGIELCEKLYRLRPQTVRMILTAYSDPSLLFQAISLGHVYDYIVKPWKKSELKAVFDKAFEDYKQKAAKLKDLEERAAQTDGLRAEIREIYDPAGIIGAGTGLKKVMETVQKAAPTDSTILLLGETGTGKEILARAIHDASLRKNGPFVPVHCAALAITLLESELFGHEKGAFTGAEQTRIGRFESASGGTVFLDEIGEIPEQVQVKLLRVLQQREIQRVGGNKLIPVNVRLVAATNRNLEREVKEGRFREDLYYRLKVIVLKVPPLRERRDDIPPLAEHFLKKYGGRTGAKLTLSPRAMEHLKTYDWPGNVRELENILERASILAVGTQIEPEDLNLDIDEMLRIEEVDLASVATPAAAKSVRAQIQDQEMQSLREALMKAGGNISETARLLGVARSTLFHRLKKHGLI